MLVVKLGGSLFGNPDLLEWLKALSQPRDGGIVIVPGGGPFADQVRNAQKKWGFDDSCAHRMAVHAMEQFGEMLCGLVPRLKLVSDVKQINDSAYKKQSAVWAPCNMVNTNAVIKPDWSNSSDSLAVWLAKELQADELVLVKSISLQPGQYSVSQLQAYECVDTGFGTTLADSRFECWIAHSSQSARLNQIEPENKRWPIRVVRAEI